ncbi:SGNH/GDSL hydrolase family protein [Microbacterium keratanolyticum]|uniref:SGNH/GDSL hydrolase family protein n=1 Tax=Microbacterium keratanolyticum TaxID=67574 RepID=UPI003637B830
MNSDFSALRDALSTPAGKTWVFTGDSITHGLLHTQGQRSYTEHLHELIRGDLERTDDIVINSAISGWRLVQILDDFERRVAMWRPDIVALMIGTNDCSTGGVFPVIEPDAFRASLRKFVRRVRERGALPVLQTQPGIDIANAPERARIGEFAQAVRDIAAEEGVVLVDHYARYGEFGDGGAAWGLLNDPFHPNGAGHAMLALEFATSVEFPAHLPTMRHLEERVDARPRSAGTGLTRSGHGIRP